jgi:hypothetical protein
VQHGRATVHQRVEDLIAPHQIERGQRRVDQHLAHEPGRMSQSAAHSTAAVLAVPGSLSTKQRGYSVQNAAVSFWCWNGVRPNCDRPVVVMQDRWWCLDAEVAQDAHVVIAMRHGDVVPLEVDPLPLGQDVADRLGAPRAQQQRPRFSMD